MGDRREGRGRRRGSTVLRGWGLGVSAQVAWRGSLLSGKLHVGGVPASGGNSGGVTVGARVIPALATPAPTVMLLATLGGLGHRDAISEPLTRSQAGPALTGGQTAQAVPCLL